MPAVGKPRPAKLPATHVIVDRRTWSVVSRHTSLADAQAAWRRRAFPKPGLIKARIGSWAHTHMIMLSGAAENAAHRRTIEAAKKERRA